MGRGKGRTEVQACCKSGGMLCTVCTAALAQQTNQRSKMQEGCSLWGAVPKQDVFGCLSCRILISKNVVSHDPQVRGGGGLLSQRMPRRGACWLRRQPHGAALCCRGGTQHHL